jgi:DNA (cytosine-5)-methyltransferase 1
MTWALNLFAGIGGWEYAADDLGITVLGIENDPDTFVSRLTMGLRSTFGDVREFNPASFGTPNGLIASPPCPDFSRAGLHKGVLGKSGDLIYQVHRYALAMRPQWIVAEQVPGALPIWESLAWKLRLYGYKTWVGVMNAEQWGIPQTRSRAILMATQGKWKNTSPPPVKPFRTADALEKELLYTNMASALGWTWPQAYVGFPRKADGRDPGLDGYRLRDFRPIRYPSFSITTKARSWQVRYGVTVRQVRLWELAKLQTLPIDLGCLVGSRTSQVRQIANAIPTDLARVILSRVVD